MTKAEFLEKLRQALKGLPESDLDERIGFYSEIIDDRMEEGLTEEEAVAAVGEFDEVVRQTVTDVPLTKLVKEKIKPKRRLSAWEVVLLILGCPIWLSLIIAAFAVLFSIYVSVWAIIVSLWSVFASLAACVLGGILGGAILAVLGKALSGVALIGSALVCAGLTIFAFFGCKWATAGLVWLTKKVLSGIKSIFIGKERA